MMKMFNYSRRANDEGFNAIIDGSLELARTAGEKGDHFDASAYAAKTKELNTSIGKAIVAGTLYETQFAEKGLSIFRDPQVCNSASVHERFNAIIAEITTAIVPSTVSDTYARFLAEVKQGGYGDTGRFIIQSNDLFKVNSKGEGVRAGIAQPMFDNEITLNARPYEISTAVDWYELAAGVFDIGNFALKIGRSFEAHIFLKIVNAMTSASTQFGAAYNTNGVTPTLFGTLVQRVKAANNGMSVVAIGTVVALSNVSLTGNYQVQIGEEMNKVGYLDQYTGVPLIAIDNVIVPGTVNGSATLAISDHLIYIIPVGGSQRPIKIWMEGGQTSIQADTTQTSDRQYRFFVDMRYEVSAVVGAKYGTITLA